MDPSQTPGLSGALIALVPVVGGAVIGVLGGLAGTAYAHRLSTKTSEATERRNKLELLVEQAHELFVWLKKVEYYYFYGEQEPMEQSPMARIEALATLYFSALDKEVGALGKAESDYRIVLIEGGQKRMANNTKVPPDECQQKKIELYKPLLAAQMNLVQAARAYMTTLTSP